MNNRRLICEEWEKTKSIMVTRNCTSRLDQYDYHRRFSKSVTSTDFLNPWWTRLLVHTLLQSMQSWTQKSKLWNLVHITTYIYKHNMPNKWVCYCCGMESSRWKSSDASSLEDVSGSMYLYQSELYKERGDTPGSGSYILK